jgi:hypothetical protein
MRAFSGDLDLQGIFDSTYARDGVDRRTYADRHARSKDPGLTPVAGL